MAKRLAVLAVVACMPLLVFSASRLSWLQPNSKADFEFKRFYLDIYSPVFVPERLPDGTELYRQRRNMGSDSDSFVMPKPARTFRIFVVGGSVAQFFKIWPNGGSWAATLGMLAPGWRFEVINCGFSAYDSARDLLNVREVAGYQPDAIVLFSGNNEFYSPPLLRHPRLAFLALRMRRFAWFRSLQDRLPRTGAAYNRRQRDAEFDANLREMIRLASRRGARTVVCTLANNLADYAPHGEFPFQRSGFLRAWEALEAGRAAEAASGFRRYAGEHPREPLPRFFLGRALEARGEREPAMQAYRDAAELDETDVMRCPPGRNELMRKAAREEGAAVADLERDFLQLDPRSGLGIFYDGVHWFREYNPYAAAVITRALAAPGTGPVAWKEEELGRWLEDAARPPIAREARDAYLFRVLVHVGQLSAPETLSPRAWELMASLDRMESGSAARLPSLREGFFAWGLANSQDPAELRARWPRLLALDGAGLTRGGRAAASLAVLQEARRAAPEDPVVEFQWASSLSRAGRRRESLGALDRSEEFGRLLAIRGNRFPGEITLLSACLRAGSCEGGLIPEDPPSPGSGNRPSPPY